jgi:hypothetical protein
MPRRRKDGFVAKIGSSAKNVLLTVRLRSEQLANEVRLANGISLGYPPHSAFPHHVHRLDSSQGAPCCCQRTVAFRQPRSAFHIAMVLLHHVVQVLALTKPTSAADGSFAFQGHCHVERLWADGMLNECPTTRTVAIGSREKSSRMPFGSTTVLR